MISRASLFNKGIYKSTLRRYLWGSILYFILLFMITGMSILLNYSHDNGYLPMINGRRINIILSNEYYTLDDLRYNKKVGIMFSKEELTNFLKEKEQLIENSKGLSEYDVRQLNPTKLKDKTLIIILTIAITALWLIQVLA